MPTNVVDSKLGGKLVVWGLDAIEPKTIEQAHKASRLPFVKNHIALMPDAHFGMGSTVGSVIPTEGAVIPAAIGVDIGCGMIAVETNLSQSMLPDSLHKLHGLIEAAIPAGKGGDRQGAWEGLYGTDERVLDLYGRRPWFPSDAWDKKLVNQCGTLGGGNHFLEVSIDERGVVWVVLHSGSRGLGNILATQHIENAQKLMKAYFIDLEDKDLAYLVEGTAEFSDYIRAMKWAQDYAMVNREIMMDEAMHALRTVVPIAAERQRINCHHNFTEKESHFGRNLWITRKGAVRARLGDQVIIPGSMADGTYIARGLQSDASFHSCSHGAGRVMGRNDAKRRFTASDLEARMKGITWNAAQAAELVDEIPDAYKPIDEVMASQADLVEVEHVLHQVLSFKGAK